MLGFVCQNSKTLKFFDCCQNVIMLFMLVVSIGGSENTQPAPFVGERLDRKTFPSCHVPIVLRFLSSQFGEPRDESNSELYVQREENGLGSSRFSIGSSFRWLSPRGTKEGELPTQQSADQFKKQFHRFNHRVVGSSDVVFKNRWSNVSSSDLVFLNSEFLNDATGARFMRKKSIEVEEIQKENDQMMSTINQTGHSFLNFPGLPTTSDSTKKI